MLDADIREVLNGGRINNQGSSASGAGTITIAEGGALINDGYVENISNSTVVNNGTISYNGRFEIRAHTTFNNTGTIGGAVALNIHSEMPGFNHPSMRYNLAVPGFNGYIGERQARI